MKSHPRFLLLQARKAQDPMRRQEVECFAWALGCPVDQIEVVDLIEQQVSGKQLAANDVVLIGGSGDYSVTSACPWLDRAMDLIRDLHHQGKPTYGSCWGFQAIVKALGGTVVHDTGTAELGSYQVSLTESGRTDPVLGPLGDQFAVFLGHEDRADTLPPDAVNLASTERVDCQALRIVNKPIYAMQFHVELNLESFLQRVASYPRYVEEATGLSMEEYLRQCREIPEISAAIRRFVEQALGMTR